jgi:DNA polymerase eta
VHLIVICGQNKENNFKKVLKIIMTDRIITLIDMDCFYCQVEDRLNPDLKGKPIAVVQYNAWKGGGIIAVNYEARDFGVTRNMRGDEAKLKCPEIILVKVPEVRGKADLSKYRNAGKEVIQVLLQFGATVERASVDEAYLDLTALVQDKLPDTIIKPDMVSNTVIVGGEENKEAWLQKAFDETNRRSDEVRLAIGASIVEDIRAEVFNQTQFR